MPGIVLQLVTGLASAAIFVPSVLIGWFVSRWWQVLLGAVVVGVLSDAEFLLIEAPGADIDWASEPLGLVAPLFWCAAGFLSRGWYRRVCARRPSGTIRVLPVVAGMLLGAGVVAALAFGVALLYLQAGQLEDHLAHSIAADGSAAYEGIFFEYLFPGLLLGQLVGGLIGRVLGRPRPVLPA